MVCSALQMLCRPSHLRLAHATVRQYHQTKPVLGLVMAEKPQLFQAPDLQLPAVTLQEGDKHVIYVRHGQPEHYCA